MAMWLAIASIAPIYGQYQEPALNSLWRKVVQNYPGIGVKTSAVDAAILNERVVKSNRLPQLRAQAQNTYGTYAGSAGGFFPQPGFFNVSGSVPSEGNVTAASTFGSATIEWEIVSFGRRIKESQAAKVWSEKTVNEKEAYLLNLKKILSERYITLLYHHTKLDLSSRNAERLDSIRYITSGLSAAGLRPAADSLLASSSYVQAMGEYHKWHGLREASSIKLTELHGDDAIQYLTSSARFVNPGTDYPGAEKTLAPAHPALAALDKQSRYYFLSGEARRRSSWPSLQLLGGYSYRGTGIGPKGMVSGAWTDGFTNTTHSVLAGVGITWHVTGLHTNRLQGKKLSKDAESTRLLLSQYEQALQADLSASGVKIGQQYRQLQETKLAVKQSQGAYRMYLARYRSGIISLSELLQIRTLLEQAENAHIEASREYWMLLAAEAELTGNFDFLFNQL